VKQALKFVLIAASSVALSACGLFGDEKDESLEPVKLVKFDASIKVRRLWSAKLGGDSENLRMALRPVGDGARIYAAGREGNVTAFDPETGKRIWHSELDMELSAGPGVGEGVIVVVGSDGYVVALNAADGTERWRSNIGGESLARPLIADGAVIVQTVDNRLRALQLFDGSERWVVLQSVPALTMRGTASPRLSGRDVIAGFDNGYVLAVNTETGDITWQALLAPPTGRSDLERLSDVDGNIAVVGQDIYAAGYQGRVGALASESGQILWAVDLSTYVGVAVDWNSLYTTQDDGTVISMDRRNGAESWRQESLLRRDPTLPVPFNTTVVVGDFEGYLHFFNILDGEPAARVKLGSKAISTTPVVVANRLYVQSDSGTLAAYEIDAPERSPERAPDIAEEEGT
jgi:outer membrane protein assembly factor BamB